MYRFLTPLLLLLISCSPGPRSGAELLLDIRVPTAVIVDQVIEGNILGQRLNNPYSVAVASDGSWYLVDNGNHRIICFDAAMKPVRQTGGYGFSAGLLNHPGRITLDNDLNLLVADEGNRRIVRYDTRLNYVDEIELRDDDDPFRYGRPAGLSVTEYGEVWVADADQDRLIVFDNVGNFNRFIGDFGYGGGQLSRPGEVLLDRRGEFLVCDRGGSRLVRYDSYGSFIDELAIDGIVSPNAAAADKGLLWVLDDTNGRLACCTRRSGCQLLTTGPTLVGSHVSMNNPRDVDVAKDGRLMIVDSGNNRILLCRLLYDEPD